MNKIENWSYNIKNKNYEVTEMEPFSVFPTVVFPEKKAVYCRQCHRWEYILAFRSDVLMSQCGKCYKGPFLRNNDIFNYGYQVRREKGNYIIDVKSQTVDIKNRRLIDNNFVVDFGKKQLIKNGKPVFDSQELYNCLCKEVTDSILSEMGDKYKEKYGIKPTVASKLVGFNVIIGYLLSPFNVNFYRIAQHWGLNPYDKDFINLSSGDTPTAENEMFSSLDIKPTKAIRKMYQETPFSVICYAAAKDLGFTDVNILQKSYSARFYVFLRNNMISFANGDIFYGCRMALKHYVQDLLQLTNQKTVWNSIERTMDFYCTTGGKINKYILTQTYFANSTWVIDGINAYEEIREHLTADEKKEIMREGFNDYTHDYLVRRIDQLGVGHSGKQHEEINVHFDIEQKFLDLEYKAGDPNKKVKNPVTGLDEIVPKTDDERFCFYVARDSKTLKEIGSAMHNCVGWGYKNACKNKDCTIVYAKYQGKYRICIEVTPSFGIRQSLGPCNQPLNQEELVAYREWCNEKNIVFTKAFSIHCAPRG